MPIRIKKGIFRRGRLKDRRETGTLVEGSEGSEQIKCGIIVYLKLNHEQVCTSQHHNKTDI